jgi:hypothetical protein
MSHVGLGRTQGGHTAGERSKDDLARQIEYLELVIKLKLYQAYISDTFLESMPSMPWLDSSKASCQGSLAAQANAVKPLDPIEDCPPSPISILNKRAGSLMPGLRSKKNPLRRIRWDSSVRFSVSPSRRLLTASEFSVLPPRAGGRRGSV